MKNKIAYFCFISSILIYNNALAIDCPQGTPEGHQCYDCSTGGSTCVADYDTSNKKMVISGQGAMIGYPNCPWSDVKSQIKTLEIEEGITNVGSHIFRDASSLTEVTLPSTLHTIGEHAFGPSGLSHIDIPEGVTTIGSRAFVNTNIKNLVLPSTIKSISQDNFLNLETLMILGENIPTLSPAAFNTPKVVYCSETSNCADWLQNTRVDLSKIKTFSLNGTDYWLDGKKYESLENLQIGKNIPIRIYSVQDATYIVNKNKNGNSFTLKYR